MVGCGLVQRSTHRIAGGSLAWSGDPTQATKRGLGRFDLACRIRRRFGRRPAPGLRLCVLRSRRHRRRRRFGGTRLLKRIVLLALAIAACGPAEQESSKLAALCDPLLGEIASAYMGVTLPERDQLSDNACQFHEGTIEEVWVNIDLTKPAAGVEIGLSGNSIADGADQLLTIDGRDFYYRQAFPLTDPAVHVVDECGHIFGLYVGHVTASQTKELPVNAREMAMMANEMVRYLCGEDDGQRSRDETDDATKPDPGVAIEYDTDEITSVFVIAGDHGQISPDGERLVVGSDEATCLVDIESANTRWCIENAYQLGGFDALNFSPDSHQALFAPRPNRDLTRVDLESGELRIITDDGVNDTTHRDAPLDWAPLWLNDSEALAYRMDEGRISLMSVDAESGTIQRSVKLPTRTSPSGREVPAAWPEFPPVVDGQTAYVEGRGEILVVDLASFVLVDQIDYMDQYKPVTPNAQPSFELQPVALADSSLILLDENIKGQWQRGKSGGASSGAYVLDIDSGRLTPLFASSPPTGGWLGPLAIGVQPEGDLIVLWIDETRRDEARNVPLFIISRVNLEQAYPVDPRSLSEIQLPDGIQPQLSPFSLPAISTATDGSFVVDGTDSDGVPAVNVFRTSR